MFPIYLNLNQRFVMSRFPVVVNFSHLGKMEDQNFSLFLISKILIATAVYLPLTALSPKMAEHCTLTNQQLKYWALLYLHLASGACDV